MGSVCEDTVKNNWIGNSGLYRTPDPDDSSTYVDALSRNAQFVPNRSWSETDRSGETPS